ncbi:MAG: hypothetical protein ABSF84_08015 [Acidimicrobiales bacterium]
MTIVWKAVGRFVRSLPVLLFVARIAAFFGFMSLSQIPPTTFQGPPTTTTRPPARAPIAPRDRVRKKASPAGATTGVSPVGPTASSL